VWNSLPWTPMNRRPKFDAASSILCGEIRNRTNTQTNKTNSNRYIHTLPMGMCGLNIMMLLRLRSKGHAFVRLLPFVCLSVCGFIKKLRLNLLYVKGQILWQGTIDSLWRWSVSGLLNWKCKNINTVKVCGTLLIDDTRQVAPLYNASAVEW